jgi:transposase-like protein
MRTRRKFTGEFKSRVVLELLSGEKTVAEACREYDVTAQMVNDWKAQFLAGAPGVFEKASPSSGEAVGKLEDNGCAERLMRTIKLSANCAPSVPLTYVRLCV